MAIKNENQKKPENEKQHNSIGRFLSIRIGSYLPLCRKVKEWEWNIDEILLNKRLSSCIKRKDHVKDKKLLYQS